PWRVVTSNSRSCRKTSVLRPMISARTARIDDNLGRGTDGSNPLPSYPSGDGRLSSVGLIWRDCAVVQTPVFAPVQETVRWQVSRYWLVVSGVAGGASSRSKRS